MGNGYDPYKISWLKIDHWRSTFKTKDGLYEWLVLPFGLSNAPGNFMWIMNQVLRPSIGKFVIVYFDDILIFSNGMEMHIEHLREVLNILKAKRLFINLGKSELCKEQLLYLGNVISANGLSVDPEEVRAILEWPTPKNITEVKTFHGFVNLYKKFIRNFNGISALVCTLVFTWAKAIEQSFEQLKKKVTEAPILVLPDFKKIFTDECDALAVEIGGVLSQESNPVAYFNEKINEAKKKYSTYDKRVICHCTSIKVMGAVSSA